jgi:hypothetical protein
MLNDTGNAFALHYFDFKNGRWSCDLEATLPGAGSYLIDYTRENEARVHAVIDQRFQEWQSDRAGLHSAPELQHD